MFARTFLLFIIVNSLNIHLNYPIQVSPLPGVRGCYGFMFGATIGIMKSEIHKREVASADAMIEFGAKLGRELRGGEVVELVSDVGGGKTTLVRGIARGIDSEDQVMSPTFTLSREYRGPRLELHHFDFYRLSEPGMIAAELAESLEDSQVSVVLEWSDIVADVLPAERLRIDIINSSEDTRQLKLKAHGARHRQLLEAIS